MSKIFSMSQEYRLFLDEIRPDKQTVVSSLFEKTKRAEELMARIDDAGSFCLPNRAAVLCAAGQALVSQTVFTPLLSSTVSTEAYSEIRNAIAIPKLNVRIVALHDTKDDALTGSYAQVFEDIALMRALPNFSVFVPSDIATLRKTLDFLLHYQGPAYVKLTDNAPRNLFLDDQDDSISIGNARFITSGESITICACGIMVQETLRAAEVLRKQGVYPEILDCFNIKPFPEKALLASIRKTGCCLVVEKHSLIGGLYSAVAECVCKTYPVPVRYVAVEDHFGQSGDIEELDAYHGLSTQEIVHNAVQLLVMRRR